MKNFFLLGSIIFAVLFFTFGVKAEGEIRMAECNFKWIEEDEFPKITDDCEEEVCNGKPVYFKSEDSCQLYVGDIMNYLRSLGPNAFPQYACVSDIGNYACKAADFIGDNPDDEPPIIQSSYECSENEPLETILNNSIVIENNNNKCANRSNCDEGDSSYCENKNQSDTGYCCYQESSQSYCCQAGITFKPDVDEQDPTDSFKGCDGIKDEEERADCEDCVGTPGNATGAIWTELGCIDPSPAGVVTRIFQIALGIMGGVAVVRFIQIALVYQSNNPDKIAQGPQMIISLVGGIIMLILGIIVLKFLGINILGLPEGFLG